MRHFSLKYFDVATDNRVETRSKIPSPESASSGTTMMPRRHFWPTRLIMMLGLTLAIAILGGVGLHIYTEHDRELADAQREIDTISLMLAEHVDQELRAIEVVQKSILERIRLLGISTPEEYEHQLSGYDTPQTSSAMPLARSA